VLDLGRAVDPTILVTISSLSTQQANPTENTLKAVLHLLDYCGTHPNPTIRYHASDMVLHVESDALYLSEKKAKSRSAGYFYLGKNPEGEELLYPPINGAVLVNASIIKETVASAAEAELAALFHNAQDAIPLIHALTELEHPQPPTPIQTDNSTAAGLANDTVRQRRSKSMDMRWFWVRDKVGENIFNIYWNTGKTNRVFPNSTLQHITKQFVRRTWSPTTTVNQSFSIKSPRPMQVVGLTRISKQWSTPFNPNVERVLISSSGLPASEVSIDPHYSHELLAESAEHGSDPGQLPESMQSKVASHKLCSSR
jgi:hypothetical protein